MIAGGTRWSLAPGCVRVTFLRVMPEAIAVLSVAFLIAALFVILKLMHRKPHGPAEIQRLREHIAWLEDRMRHATEKNWDADMKRRIEEQLDEARASLAAHAP